MLVTHIMAGDDHRALLEANAHRALIKALWPHRKAAVKGDLASD